MAWLSDPQLGTANRRTLASMTYSAFFKALARGLLVAVSVLFATTQVKLSAGETAWAFTIAGGLGLMGSLLGGFLSDRWHPRTVAAVSSFLAAAALTGLAVFPHASVFVVLLSIATFADRVSSSSNATLAGIAVPGDYSVLTRALMRTVGNIGISLGAAAAVPVLLASTAPWYVAAFAVMAALEALAGGFLLRVGADRPAPAAKSHFPVSMVARDGKYLTFALLAGLMSVLYLVLDFLLPMWITTGTSMPTFMISAAVILNTVLVVSLQMRFAAMASGYEAAVRQCLLSGGALALATVLFSASGSSNTVLAIIALLLGVATLSVAEVVFSAAGWTLSYALADQRRLGAYQGVFSFGTSLGVMAAPLILTFTVVNQGLGGWLQLGTGFLGLAAAMFFILRHRSFRRAGTPELVTVD
ncbi:MFS transporter [Pseudarthrobacter sp. CCNWLW207]|uniref:MFS transporter n=1 Tax=Pseudarthrobacter sp. CCNWLW207 TaxID=3127468 RepID=UPI003076BD3C